MRKRIGILASLVEKHYNDVYFLVDTNNTFVQEVKLRIAQQKPFGYEIKIDDFSEAITALLNAEINTKSEPFGKIIEEKARIIVDIKISSSDRKRKKMIEELEGNLEKKYKQTLMQTQGLQEDKETNSDVEEEEESVEKLSKALELVTTLEEKVKIMKTTNPKMRKDENKVTPQPLSPPKPKRESTRVVATTSVKPPMKKAVQKITSPSDTSAFKRKVTS